MPDRDEYYMREALKEARKAFEEDEVPVGAVIVHKNSIIARAHNQVETLKDPSAHAEMIAITQATSALECKWLNDCIIYVTLEPCSMCAGAIVLARIPKLVFGATDPKTGACGSVLNIIQQPQLNHRVEFKNGICEEDCSSLMSEFFELKRRKNISMMN